MRARHAVFPTMRKTSQMQCSRAGDFRQRRHGHSDQLHSTAVHRRESTHSFIAAATAARIGLVPACSWASRMAIACPAPTSSRTFLVFGCDPPPHVLPAGHDARGGGRQAADPATSSLLKSGNVFSKLKAT
jgi:hypothetical protein